MFIPVIAETETVFNIALIVLMKLNGVGRILIFTRDGNARDSKNLSLVRFMIGYDSGGDFISCEE